MAINGPTGLATPGGVQGIVFDSQGVAVAPQRPFTLLADWERSFRSAWASLDELNASLKENAPVAGGLPAGSPSPYAVFAEGGRLVRYVPDPLRPPERFVERAADGSETVSERVFFCVHHVALTLEGARTATDKMKDGEPLTDFWCGFTWLQGGYSPERWAPTEVASAQRRQTGAQLSFTQPLLPTDVARIRHEVARLDRSQPTLPIHAAPAELPTAAPDLTDTSDTPAEAPLPRARTGQFLPRSTAQAPAPKE